MWKNSGMTTIPSSQIINDTLPFTDENGNVIPVDLYQFNVSFKFNDYTKTPTKQPKKPQKSETGFVIGHFAARTSS